MIIELGLLLAKLLVGKGIAGAVAGMAAGVTAEVTAGAALASSLKSAGIAGSIASHAIPTAIGFGVGEAVEKAFEKSDSYYKTSYDSDSSSSSFTDWSDFQREAERTRIEMEQQRIETHRWWEEHQREAAKTADRITRYLRDDDTGNSLDNPYNIHWEGKELRKLLKQEAKFYDNIGKHKTAARYRKRLAEEEAKAKGIWY